MSLFIYLHKIVLKNYGKSLFFLSLCHQNKSQNRFFFFFFICLPNTLVKFKSYLRPINLHFVCFGIFIGEENKSKKFSYLMMFDCDDENNSKYIYIYITHISVHLKQFI